MNKRYASYIKIVVFTVFFTLLDQLTKYLAVTRLKGKNDFIIIKDVLRLHYLDGGNTGAAWGILSGKITVFIVFTIIAIILLSFLIRNIQYLLENNYSQKNTALKILNYSMAFLIAGAAGNLIDRIMHGYVIDFIYFELINFPVFNVADCYVTISCAVIIIISFFNDKDNNFNKIFTLKKPN